MASPPSKLYSAPKLLGQGGFGCVFKAHDKTYNRTVAIKKIPKTEYKSIEREINLLRACNSKYIIRILNDHTDDDYQWVVLEYCAGGSMENKAGKLTESELKKMSRDVLE
eukprot:385678_1